MRMLPRPIKDETESVTKMKTINRPKFQLLENQTRNATIFQSIDPTWKKWGASKPGCNTEWLTSLELAINHCKRNGYPNPKIVRSYYLYFRRD